MKDTHGMTGEPWWGFDLDGTLAEKTGAWKGIEYIGEPIKPMVELARELHYSGKKIKIFTARVAPHEITAMENSVPGFGLTGERIFGESFVWKCKDGKVGMDKSDFYKKFAHQYIQEWCYKHLFFVPEITCVKDQLMQELYDDRAVQLIENLGLIVGDVLFRKLKDFASTIAILCKYIDVKQVNMAKETADEIMSMEQKAKEVLTKWDYHDVL